MATTNENVLCNIVRRLHFVPGRTSKGAHFLTLKEVISLKVLENFWIEGSHFEAKFFNIENKATPRDCVISIFDWIIRFHSDFYSKIYAIRWRGKGPILPRAAHFSLHNLYIVFEGFISNKVASLFWLATLTMEC